MRTIAGPAEQPSPDPPTSGLDLAEAARAMAAGRQRSSKDVDRIQQAPAQRFIGARGGNTALPGTSRTGARRSSRSAR